MRIVYLGTPSDAIAPLRALVAAGHDVALVITQPDRRRSRGAGSDPSPVKQAARALGLRVLTPEKARDVVDEVRASGAQLGVVVAFGQLLPVALLDALPNGFVNLHFSLLPRWRGAAPVERAILAGDEETGVDLMRIEAGLDTGPVYARVRVPIDSAETAGELHARLVDAGTELLVDHLPAVPTTEPSPQVGEPTYADKLTVDEFRLDPRRPAAELVRVVRAGNPRPGAWLRVGARRVKVWRAHTADDLDAREDAPSGTIDRHAALGTNDGVLVLDEVQPEGKRVMAGAAWRAGLRGDVHVEPVDHADPAEPVDHPDPADHADPVEPG
ncbi:MAG: methionyl-tRNA formyltransferase [Actinomycetota bacterium]|nr:methionyl-tRNA formyltransferase [Actinomycetota bacterium]